MSQKQDKRNKRANQKIFSPINNNLGIREKLDILQNEKELIKQQKTIDSINFIESTTELDVNLRNISNFRILIIIDERPANLITFRDEAVADKSIGDKLQLNTKTILKKNTSILEESKQNDAKHYYERYTTDARVFREDFTEDNYSRLKSKTQAEDSKEFRFTNKDKFLAQKREHQEQFQNSIIVQSKVSNYATWGDSTRKETPEQFKFENSVDLGLNQTNNGSRTISPTNFVNKNIISKKFHPIDKFLGDNRSNM